MSSTRPELRLDWCSHEAATYAVKHWHYSRSMPTPPLVKIGVWENGRFIGAVLFGRGANNNIGKPYGLGATEVCELVRVALAPHASATTRVVRIAIGLLRQHAPGLRLIVSYADPNEGHHGGIYQGGNWLYSGTTPDDFKAIDRRGRVWHSRQVSHTGVKRQYGEARRVPRHDECRLVPLLGKHRYLYPLDDAMRAQVAPLARPYPKRPCPTGVDSDAAPDQGAEADASSSVGLQSTMVGA